MKENMLKIKQLPNGNLLVPGRVESDDEVIGDGLREITPSDSDFQIWFTHLEKQKKININHKKIDKKEEEEEDPQANASMGLTRTGPPPKFGKLRRKIKAQNQNQTPPSP
jgi:hypothetical protein